MNTVWFLAAAIFAVGSVVMIAQRGLTAFRDGTLYLLLGPAFIAVDIWWAGVHP